MIIRSTVLVSCLLSVGVVGFAPTSPASRVSPSSLKAVTEEAVKTVADEKFHRRLLAAQLLYSKKETKKAEPTESKEKTKTTQHDFALLFDCDGVILETEELHRLAYNAAFQEFGVTRNCGKVSEPVDWSVGYYDILQNSIGGGKPKMRHYFSQLLRFESNEFGDPTTVTATIPGKKKGKKKKTSMDTEVTVTANDIATGLESLIDRIQTRKTALYKKTVEETASPRPGLLDLMDAALADESIAVGVCSAATKEAAQKVLECTLGAERIAKLDVCILGDDVSEKKPSPMIYNAAREKLGIDLPTKCVVVEDSAVGLRAAKAAGMRSLITYTSSTTNEDFYGMGADAKVPDLVNNGNPVTLESIFGPLREAFASNDGSDQTPELLVGLKDEIVEEEYDEDDNLIVENSGNYTMSLVEGGEETADQGDNEVHIGDFKAEEVPVGDVTRDAFESINFSLDPDGKRPQPTELVEPKEEEEVYVGDFTREAFESINTSLGPDVTPKSPTLTPHESELILDPVGAKEEVDVGDVARGAFESINLRLDPDYEEDPKASEEPYVPKEPVYLGNATRSAFESINLRLDPDYEEEPKASETYVPKEPVYVGDVTRSAFESINLRLDPDYEEPKASETAGPDEPTPAEEEEKEETTAPVEQENKDDKEPISSDTKQTRKKPRLMIDDMGNSYMVEY